MQDEEQAMGGDDKHNILCSNFYAYYLKQSQLSPTWGWKSFDSLETELNF